MITVNAAHAMNLKDHALRVGFPANLVVLQTPNVLEALREHAAPLYVISSGKLIDSDKMRRIAETGEMN
jgi:cytosine deaminase